MVERAEAMAERAAQDGLRLINERARGEVDPTLARRVYLATQIGVYAMCIGALMRELLASGEQVWSRVRLNSNENVAWSCVPDPNAVSLALVGQLLRSGGLGLDGLAQLSPMGLNALHSFEGVCEIVQRQNDALIARLQ